MIGRELTIEDRIRGQKITTDIGNGKKGSCLKCWIIRTDDGKVINFRPAGTASNKTETTTATIDIMHFNQINRGKKTEFKFLWNGEK